MNEGIIRSIELLRDILFDVVHYGPSLDENYAKLRLTSVGALLLDAIQSQDNGSEKHTAPPCSAQANDNVINAIYNLIGKYSIPYPHGVVSPKKIVDDLNAIVRLHSQQLERK